MAETKDNIVKDKMEDYCLNMGMMDTFDYYAGEHPGIPDDEWTIKNWIEFVKDRWKDE